MKNACTERSRSAFTLIELLVTISIMGILFGVGIAKYNDFNRRQIVTQAVLELKSNLRLIQNKASSGEKDTNCILGLQGWCVAFSANSYEYYSLCGDQRYLIKPINLSAKNIEIVAVPTGFCFKPLAQGLDFFNDGITEATITLTGFGFSQTVTVSKTGEIK